MAVLLIAWPAVLAAQSGEAPGVRRASAGLGYIPVSDISEPVQLLLGLGLGYTWRRAPP